MQSPGMGTGIGARAGCGGCCCWRQLGASADVSGAERAQPWPELPVCGKSGAPSGAHAGTLPPFAPRAAARMLGPVLVKAPAVSCHAAGGMATALG